jgi:transposase
MIPMDVDCALAPWPGLQLLHLVQQAPDPQLVLTVISTAPTASCPLCQTPSGHLHCYYPRTLQDLAWGGRSVRLQLRARRFVCANPTCPRRTFAERVSEQIPVYAHRTKQCQDCLHALGLALGGKAGARLAQTLRIPASSDTILRLVRVRGVEEPEQLPPQVLGIDDFALRKGAKYATMLVDLERQQLVDLLPDREKETVVVWLQAHYPASSPGLQVVSRDRGGAYAEAVREAAPAAIQVADRFHLAHNLGETVERILRRYSPTIQKIFGAGKEETPPSDQAPPLNPPLPLLRHEADKAVSQRRRMAVYEHVVALVAQGYSQTEMAEQLRMSPKKIRRLLQGPPQPPVYRPQATTRIGPYKPYLRQRFAEEGCANSLQLYREIREQGYDGCRSVVTNYVTQLRQEAGLPAQTGKHTTRQPKPLREHIPAPSQIRWWFLLPMERLSAKQQEQLSRLCPGVGPGRSPGPGTGMSTLPQNEGPELPAIRQEEQGDQVPETKQPAADLGLIYQLAQAFMALLHEHTDEHLTEWLVRVQKSRVPELLSFAGGIRRDEAAVRAGLRLKWSHARAAYCTPSPRSSCFGPPDCRWRCHLVGQLAGRWNKQLPRSL